ncbi:metallopeptidase family protein [Caulobacter sp. LARHSG274]
MTWTDRLAPSPDDFAVLARRTFEALPADVRRQAGEVVFQVEDFAADALLDDLGIEDPFELTGLYSGPDPARQASDPSTPVFVLYRRPILDEWCERGDVALGELVIQVLAYELGKVGGIPVDYEAGPLEDWSGTLAPSLEDFAEIAGRALEGLPPPIRAAVGDVQVRVEEFADDETLDALGIADPFELTGVYEGVDLTRRSLFDAVPGTSAIRLFRRPILDEWCEGEVGFQSLVQHVLVHEVAHHFGFSDAGIDQVERS